MSQTVGTIQYLVEIDTSSMRGSLRSLDKAVSDSTDNVVKGTDSGERGFLKMGAALGVVAGIAGSVVTKAIDAVTSSIGAAVARVDTLKNADRAFQNMGFSAADTTKVMKDLNKSILGLPTSLDSAVRNVELLASATSDIKKSQKLFQALNDGILGFGGTADQVNTAVIQLSQSFAGGRVYAQDWNSMLNAGLGPALNAIAKQMGITTGALKDGLGDGSISVEKFQDALINLDQKGGGGMASLQKIVKDSTSGIGTGFTNAQTAITRGLADIIKAIGSENISNAITAIGKGFESALKNVSGFINFLKENKGVITFFLTIITGVTAALATYNTYVKVSAVLTGIYTVAVNLFATTTALMTQGLTLAEAAMTALNVVMGLNPIGLVVVAIGALVAGLIYFFTQTKLGKDIFKATWDFIVGVVSAAPAFFSGIWSTITNVFSASVKFIGGIIKSIGDFFTATAAVVSGVITTIGNVFTSLWTNYIQPVANFIIGILTTISDVFVKIFAFIAVVILGTLFIIGGAIVQQVQGWLNTISTVLNAILTVITAVWSVIAPYITAALMAISNVITTVWGAISGAVSAAVNFIWGVIQVAWGNIVGNTTAVFNTIMAIITGVWSAIAGFFGPIIANIVNTVVGGFRNLYNGVSGLIGSLISVAGSIGGKVLSALGNFGSLLYNKGRDLVQGLINGAGSLLSSVGKFFLDKLPGWIRDPFAKALGIHSPSKVFMGFGKNITEGLVNGIGAGMTSVNAAVDQMSNMAISPVVDVRTNPVGSLGNEAQIGSVMGPRTAIGQVNISSELDGRYWLQKLNGDTTADLSGLTPQEA